MTFVNMHMRRLLALAAAAGVSVAMLTGCGAGDQPGSAPTQSTQEMLPPQGSAPRPSSTSSPPPAPTAGGPSGSTATPATPGAPSEEDGGPSVSAPARSAAQAAQRYLQGRENIASWYQQTPTSWLEATAPVMSPQMRSEYEAMQSTDSTWTMAHELGLSVKVIADCEVTDAAGPATATWQMLQCSVLDQPLGRDGTPLATTKIPAEWPLVGQQQAATLELKKTGSRWVVVRDWTGQAS